MTDAFPTGSPPPQPSAAGRPAAGDVAATLSDLEHKLRELEVELSAVRHGPGAAHALQGAHPAPDPPPPPRPRPPRPPAPRGGPAAPPRPGPDGVRLVDEALSEPGPRPLRAPAPQSGRPGPAAPPGGPAAPPREAAELVAHVRTRMAGVATQLEELMRLRRELEMRAHTLAAQGTAPAPAAAPWPAPAPAAGLGAPRGEEAWFEGRIELDVGPFDDITALAAFERALGELPEVAEARVRGYGANRALIDLRLDAPAALLADMRRLLGDRFTVLEAGAGRLSLALEGRPPA